LTVVGTSGSVVFTIGSTNTTLDFQPGTRFGTASPGFTTIDPNGNSPQGLGVWDLFVVNGGCAIGSAYAQTTPPANGLIVAGNVGIGKNPGTALDVNGTVTATAFSGSAASLTSFPTLNQNTTGSSASCTGSAAQLGGLTKSQLWNNNGQIHGIPAQFADIPNFGNYFVQAASTELPPGGTGLTGQYYTESFGLGDNYAYTSYVMQWAMGRNIANPYLNIRYRENGTWGSWYKVSAGYADTAGSLAVTSPAWNLSKLGQANQSGVITYSQSDYSRNVTIVLGSGTVQVPVAGLYQLNFHSFVDAGISGSGGVYFRVNGNKYGARTYSSESQAYRPITINAVISLAVNDILSVYTEITFHGNDSCNFSGHLIA
jgi:hypothetical protein